MGRKSSEISHTDKNNGVLLACQYEMKCPLGDMSVEAGQKNSEKRTEIGMHTRRTFTPNDDKNI